MSNEAAEWVRANAWTHQLRADFQQAPQYYLRCACQHGPTNHCVTGQHHRCHPGALPARETAIRRADGVTTATWFTPAPYLYAHVWLADRTCAYRCPCTCHTPAPARPVQLALELP